MVTDHEMRMEALRLFEENESLRDQLSKANSKVFYLVEVLKEIRTYSTDPTAVNGAADALDDLLPFLDRLKVSPLSPANQPSAEAIENKGGSQS
jgi:hypothetical protein